MALVYHCHQVTHYALVNLCLEPRPFPNPHLNKWNLSTCDPELDKPVFILVEHDVVDESAILKRPPFVRYASFHQNRMYQNVYYWKLLDYDPKYEEEILQQYYSVVAWRYAT